MVVFFDIDGTIVDNETQIIPESAIRAIDALGKNGHLAVVNTGRPYAHIDKRIRDLPFGAFVCACGMEVRLGDGWLYRKHPDQQQRRYLLTAIRECGMQTMLEPASELMIVDGENTVHPLLLREAELTREKGMPLREADDYEELPFIKGITYDWPGCDREGFLQRLEPYFDCIIRENTMIEFVLKGCSKANGMLELLKALEIPVENTLAIGDSTNDVPMFLVAKHTVCMGNGMEELKAQAEYITGSVMEDGIEQALRHYGLI
jgi:Cof subfamily protein (haloacid dehalogenase superfamily)